MLCGNCPRGRRTATETGGQSVVNTARNGPQVVQERKRIRIDIHCLDRVDGIEWRQPNESGCPGPKKED